jgi:hypothetical protein
MADLSFQLAAVLGKLPVSVGLFSRTGHVLGRMGGKMAGLFDDIAPSQDAPETVRWRFVDKRGAVIPRYEWPSARALRGEYDAEGMVGSFWQGERHAVRVTCVPTFAPDSEVAFVAFLEFLDAPMPSAAGSHQDLQQKLIRELASAIASSWPKPQLAS